MEIKDLYGLIGYPISGTKSPWIHNTVFEALDVPAMYMGFELDESQFKKGVEGLRALGAKGFSVTIPYKTEIIHYLDAVDPLAEQLGAVNVVHCDNGKWVGYNTDGTGLIAVLNRHIAKGVEKEKILILGAGGAARGIAGALIKNGAEEVGIWNRTTQKAVQLVNELNQFTAESQKCVCVESNKKFSEYSLVINTTSVGMMPHVDDTPIDIHSISPKAIVCDIVYKPHCTQLLRLAMENGHQVIYGIEMLIEQALQAQKIWLGVTEEALEPLRAQLLAEASTVE